MDRNYNSRFKNAGHFKSRGETQIARFLERNNIEYFYEHPLAVVDRGKVRTWYPDFTLPEYRLIMEYFGVNRDPLYKEQTRHKLDVYKSNGIEGIFLTEDSFRGDWPERINGRIEGFLKRRQERFCNRMQRKEYDFAGLQPYYRNP